MSRPGRPFSYYDILEASEEAGCPICRLGQRAATRHLNGVIFDSVNDVELRATLRRGLGYCPDHAWQLPTAGESAPLGIAIIYRDILNHVNKELTASRFKPAQRRPLQSLLRRGEASETDRYLQSQAGCPACERRAEIERLAFLALVEALEEQDPRLLEALSASEGLCIAHLRRALGMVESEAAFEALVGLTRAQLTALIAELDEYIRKRDHRFRHEEIDSMEGDSWLRALARASGIKPPLDER